MLLKEYLNSIGIVGFGTREGASSAHVIGVFRIGKYYEVVLLTGGRVELPDLTTLIDCIRDEAKAAPTYSFTPRVARGRDGGELEVILKNEMGRPWGRNMVSLADNLMMWTTEFNLTGEWPQDIPRAAPSAPIW